MDMTVLYFEGCPNGEVADERARLLSTERPNIRVKRHAVESPDQAERVAFLGPSSSQMNGVDVFAESGGQLGLACRRCRTPDGYAGAPTQAQLRTVLAGA